MKKYIIIPRGSGKGICNDIISRAEEMAKATSLNFSEAVCMAAKEILGGGCIMDKLRKCIIDDTMYGKFHRWVERAEIIPSSAFIGGHNGGVVKDTFALVELEDGRVIERRPDRIRFIDNEE